MGDGNEREGKGKAMRAIIAFFLSFFLSLFLFFSFFPFFSFSPFLFFYFPVEILTVNNIFINTQHSTFIYTVVKLTHTLHSNNMRY